MPGGQNRVLEWQWAGGGSEEGGFKEEEREALLTDTAREAGTVQDHFPRFQCQRVALMA